MRMDLTGVRDIAVVVLAAVALLTSLIMIVTGLLLWRLLAMVRADISPILGSLRDTADTVKGTTEAVSQAVQESAQSMPMSTQILRVIGRLIRRG